MTDRVSGLERIAHKFMNWNADERGQVMLGGPMVLPLESAGGRVSLVPLIGAEELIPLGIEVGARSGEMTFLFYVDEGTGPIHRFTKMGLETCRCHLTGFLEPYERLIAEVEDEVAAEARAEAHQREEQAHNAALLSIRANDEDFGSW